MGCCHFLRPGFLVVRITPDKLLKGSKVPTVWCFVDVLSVVAGGEEAPNAYLLCLSTHEREVVSGRDRECRRVIFPQNDHSLLAGVDGCNIGRRHVPKEKGGDE